MGKPLPEGEVWVGRGSYLNHLRPKVLVEFLPLRVSPVAHPEFRGV